MNLRPLLALALLAAALRAAPPTRADLFAHPDRLDVTLSPDGRHVAWLGLEAGRTNLWLAPIERPTEARPLLREPGRSLFAYTWAADSRALLYQTGRHNVFWTDHRGADAFVIQSLDLATGEHRAHTGPLDRRVKFTTSPSRPDEFFLSPSPRGARPLESARIDFRSGKREVVTSSIDLAPVYADGQHEPRLAVRAAALAGFDILLRADRGEWREWRKFDFAQRLCFEVHGFDAAGATAYLTHAGEHDMGALVALDLASGKETVLAQHADATISDALLHAETGKPIAYKAGRLRSIWRVLDAAFRADFDRLGAHARSLAAPATADFAIVSRTADDRRWLVTFEADVLPRRHFLYERATGEIRLLFSESQARAGSDYARTHSLAIRARDGLELVSHLTLPRAADPDGDGRPAQPLPLVIWVHGGPHSLETWKFDRQAQWLAARGYAVLNVNFRGSTGFGRKFIAASYGEWGAAMRTDLIDAARHLIDAKVADRARVALLGLSFGGYATLEALAGAPDVFACGIEIVGMSDLNLLADTTNRAAAAVTDAGLKAEFAQILLRNRMQMGGDESTPEGRAALAARSPLPRADRIRAPLLVAHGLLDTGVVPAHSEKIVAALHARKHTVTHLTYANEGHGFFRPENWTSWAAVVEEFLARHLGGAVAPALPGEIAVPGFAVPTGAEHVPGLAAAIAK